MKLCTTCILSLFALSPVTAQLRGLATCPTLDHVLDEKGVSDRVSKWLTKVDGTSFIADLFVDYLTDDTHGPLASVSGQSLLDGIFPVCDKLPLKSDQCFIAANPDQSFFRFIVANEVPFGKYIVGAVESVEDYIDEFQEDIDNFINRFYLTEETGLCIVGNDKMVGIYENPGYPNPAIYNMCSAVSKFNSGNDACTVQPYFKGFALSTAGSNALVMTDQLPGDFYDGYATYKFAPQGDAFAAFDLNMKFPTSDTASVGPDLASTIRSFLSQPPARDIEISGSLFVKNPTIEDSELLYLLTIDEMKLNLNIGTQKLLSVNFGNAFAAMRSNTANPLCQPSGIFLSANIQESSMGPLLEGFFDHFIPSIEVDVGIVMSDGASGITQFEPVNPIKSLGDIEAVFYRLKMDKVGFMGITVDKPSFEVQYFTGNEMRRRRAWTRDACCSNVNVLDSASCGVADSPMADFIKSEAREQTTLAVVFAIESISFFEVVKFKNIGVELYSQIPDENSSIVSTTIDMKCSVDVLFISGIDATAKFRVETDTDSHLTNINASFRVQASFDAELVKMTATISAFADVTNFAYLPASGRRLNDQYNETLTSRRLTLGGGSLSDADWDLDVDIKVESEVLDAILDFAEELVDEVFQNVEQAWNEIEGFAGDQWNAVKGLASDIGTPASEIVGAIDDAVGGVADLAGDGIEALSDVLSGTPLDEHIAPVIGKAAGLIGDVLANQAKAYVALGKGLFAGDISAIGNFALAPLKMAGLFGTSIRNKHMIDVPGQTDGEFGCTKKQWRFRKCKKYVFVTKCKWRHSAPFDDEDCVREGVQKKSRKLENLRRLSTAAKDKIKCQKKSKEDNAGMKWFHDRKAEGKRVLDGSLSNIHQHVGKVSAMGSNGCQKLKLSVGTKALQNSEGGGLESARRFTPVETDGCVDLRNQDSVNAALGQLQKKSSETIKEVALAESAGADKCLTGGLTYVFAPQGKCNKFVGQSKVRMPKTECEAFGGSILGVTKDPWVECLVDLCEEEAGAVDDHAIYAAGVDKCNEFVAQGSLELHHDLCSQIGGISSPSLGGMYSECNVHLCTASKGTKNFEHFTVGGYGGTCKDRVGAAILETTKEHCDSIGGYYPYSYNEENASTWLPCEAELCANHHIHVEYSEDNPVKMIATAKGECNRLLGSGNFEIQRTDCQNMGGKAADGSGVWTQCELDWCDFSAGTKSGRGYAVGSRGTCDEKAGYSIIHIPRKQCESIDGGINAAELEGTFELVACHVDWCVIEEDRGTADGVTILPGSFGGCDDHFTYGGMDMNRNLCDAVGGLYEQYPDNPEREGCFLDWCRHTGEASMLPGVSEGADMKNNVIFPALLNHCRYKAAYTRTGIDTGLCRRLDGRTNAGYSTSHFQHDCHFDWCFANNGDVDGPSDILGDAFSTILSGDNCNDGVGYGIFKMYQSDCHAIGGGYSNELAPPYDWCYLNFCEASAGTKNGRGYLPARPGTCNALGRMKVGTIQLHMTRTDCERLNGSPGSVGGTWVDCYLDLCEVEATNVQNFEDEPAGQDPEALAPNNVARNKHTAQSSTCCGGWSYRAVDGNSNADYYSGNSVTHTSEENDPWWEVDLGQNYDLGRLVIINRKDCCMDRLSKVHVFVSTTKIQGNLNELIHDPNTSHHYNERVGESWSIEAPGYGRFIRIQLSGEGFLSLAEVEAFPFVSD